jgi:hypothetical protein
LFTQLTTLPTVLSSPVFFTNKRDELKYRKVVETAVKIFERILVKNTFVVVCQKLFVIVGLRKSFFDQDFFSALVVALRQPVFSRFELPLGFVAE